jgi:hypothetical protein
MVMRATLAATVTKARVVRTPFPRPSRDTCVDTDLLEGCGPGGLGSERFLALTSVRATCLRASRHIATAAASIATSTQARIGTSDTPCCDPRRPPTTTTNTATATRTAS